MFTYSCCYAILGLSRPSPRTELTFARVSPDSIDEAVIGVITNEMQASNSSAAVPTKLPKAGNRLQVTF